MTHRDYRGGGDSHYFKEKVFLKYKEVFKERGGCNCRWVNLHAFFYTHHY